MVNTIKRVTLGIRRPIFSHCFFLITISVILISYTLFGSHFPHLWNGIIRLILSSLIVWVYEIVGFKGNWTNLGRREWYHLRLRQIHPQLLQRNDEIVGVQELFYTWMQGYALCSLHLGSRELSTFPDSSKRMLFFQPPSVICTLKPAEAKISIRSTCVLGATGHYMIKSLNNTPARI